MQPRKKGKKSRWKKRDENTEEQKNNLDFFIISIPPTPLLEIAVVNFSTSSHPSRFIPPRPSIVHYRFLPFSSSIPIHPIPEKREKRMGGCSPCSSVVENCVEPPPPPPPDARFGFRIRLFTCHLPSNTSLSSPSSRPAPHTCAHHRQTDNPLPLPHFLCAFISIKSF